MGEHIQQAARPARATRKHPSKQTVEAIGKRLVEIAVYEKGCRVGGTLNLDDLSETQIGDWKMADFRAACAFAASQGWLIAEDDEVTLTVAGLRSA